MGERWGALVTGLRTFLAAQERLYERRALLSRPWEEDFLHWSWDVRHWELHGHLQPPHDGRRRSVTPDGWCPGQRTLQAGPPNS